MGKIEKQDNKLYGTISELITQVQQTVLRNINYAMVCTYYEIGCTIVEDEQSGNKKAAYGAKTLKVLSEKLTAEFGKGFSFTNLNQMRQFYLTYSNPSIIQTVSELLNKNQGGSIGQMVSDQFKLSWPH